MNLEEFFKTLKSLPADPKAAVAGVIALLKPFEIKVSYQINQSDPEILLILTTQKNKADFKIPIVRQCSGVIIRLTRGEKEYDVKLLCMPPDEFNPRFRRKDVLSSLDDYKIYKVKDGTTVTLYFNSDRWCLATRRGYDVSALCWRGITYKAALDEVLAKYDFSFDKLKPERCYTIGFKHPKFHPFLQKMEAWVIQVRDIETREVVKCDIGLPCQEPVDKVGNIFEECEYALGEYLTSGKATYGYILRSPKMSVFIESSLMSKIRFLVYQFPFVKNAGDRMRVKKYFSDMNFICLSAFLDFKKHDMFIKLFPQYKQDFQRYTTIVNKITAVILNRGSSKNQKIDKLAKALGRHVYFSFKPQRGGRYEAKKMRVERSIVRDIIVNPRYVNTYYEILFT